MVWTMPLSSGLESAVVWSSRQLHWPSEVAVLVVTETAVMANTEIHVHSTLAKEVCKDTRHKD